jgi:hypothetical protein
MARRMNGRGLTVALILILAVALTPVISIAAASWIAGLSGCRLDEAGTYPCMIAGRDWGEIFGLMFILGWFMPITLTFGVFALIPWAVLLLIFIYGRPGG